ncbi:MAG: 23S rRNA (adenine(2030)-N(6))-methyltransferase RlmJ, partial [Nevskia sp.]|nr:23S rRNA (adenine(2030)-N(6))-methyltransferase RlmJ [Nevskia sp.]
MVHYRHSYHAGNFADVFKHALLVGLLQALSRKDKPWCFVESHAGAGTYDLEAEGALRTGEAQDGIARLTDAQGAPPAAARYLEIVRAASAGGAARRYPGSPAVALAMARPGDRLVLCEKVPEVAQALKYALRDPRVT